MLYLQEKILTRKNSIFEIVDKFQKWRGWILQVPQVRILSIFTPKRQWDGTAIPKYPHIKNFKGKGFFLNKLSVYIEPSIPESKPEENSEPKNASEKPKKAKGIGFSMPEAHKSKESDVMDDEEAMEAEKRKKLRILNTEFIFH